jgi:hypothetical protein
VLTKFLQHRLTQKIGIEFSGLCKLDNSFSDSFIKKIVFVAKLKSFASHFECDAHDPLALWIEFGTVQKLSYGHDQPSLSVIGVMMQTMRVKGVTDKQWRPAFSLGFSPSSSGPRQILMEAAWAKHVAARCFIKSS